MKSKHQSVVRKGVQRLLLRFAVRPVFMPKEGEWVAERRQQNGAGDVGADADSAGALKRSEECRPGLTIGQLERCSSADVSASRGPFRFRAEAGMTCRVGISPAPLPHQRPPPVYFFKPRVKPSYKPGVSEETGSTQPCIWGAQCCQGS